MTKLEDLKLEINRLRKRLGNYLEENEDRNKIFELNTRIDDLIVEYYRLTNEEWKDAK